MQTSSSHPAHQSIESLEQAITAQYRSLASWMENDVLPLWMSDGFNQNTGEFAESLDLNTGKDPLHTRRGRTQPRQIFSVFLAHEMGLMDDTAPLIAEKGITFLEQFSKLDDGTYAFSFEANQGDINQEFGLYKQVFVLFCYAIAARVQPEKQAIYEQRAFDLYNVLNRQFKHPEIGFKEDIAGEKNLCSNPHMHMLEATLAWELVSDSEKWSQLSDELVEVATRHLISKQTGALSEFFSPQWQVLEENELRLVEPGHQFEWAWLLSDWATRRNNEPVKQVAIKLFEIGYTYGVDKKRNLTLDQLNEDLTLRSSSAHLWPQTEWVKASLALANLDDEHKLFYLSSALCAIEALTVYLKTDTAGLWYIKQDQQGQFDSLPAQAGLLYHVLMALAEIKHYLDD